MKIAIYCRVSSVDQKENTSLSNQKELGIKFCESRGFEYVVFEEVVSGSKKGDERDVFLEIEKRIFEKEFDGLWLYDWDRMVRDVEVMIYFKNLVSDTNIKIYVGFEEKNILDGSGELEFEIGSVFSGYWKRKFLRIAKEGRNNRWREGKGLGKIGFGFDNANGEVWVNEEEANVVKDIFKFFLYKNVKKYGDCENYLIKKYGREVNGKRLDSGLVSRVIGNKKYNGKLIYKTKKDGVFEFELDKIIDDETFELANKKLKYIKGVRSINSKEIYLLKGLVYCGDCNRRMWIEGSGKLVNGKSYRYFKCSSYKENEKLRRRGLEEDPKYNCVSGSRGNKISKDKLDEIIWNCLFRVLSKSDIIIKEYQKRYNENLGTKDRFISKKGYYQKELVKLEERKNKMISLLIDNKFSESDYDSWLKSEYDIKVVEIKRKIEDVDVEISKYGYVDKIESWIDLMKEDLLKDYNIERKEDRRRLVERYIEKVSVKELNEDETNKNFEILLSVKLGDRSGNVGFEYSKKQKSLNLKTIEKDFYILNNDFVENRILLYKNELILNVLIVLKYNKCGRFELEFEEIIRQNIDFQ